MRDLRKTRSGTSVAIVGFLAGALGTVLVLRFVPGASSVSFPASADGGHALILAEVKGYALSAAMGVLTAITLVSVAKRRRGSSSAADRSGRTERPDVVRRIRSVCVAAVMLAYAITWAGGAPAASNKFLRETLRARQSAPGCDYPTPRIETVLSLPIVPGVVLAWQENQLGGQCGWGGWKLYFWRGGDPKELYSATRWLS
jgi:hypothetical protein